MQCFLMPGLQQECSWQISWTDGPVHNSRASASGNNLKYIVKEGLGEGGEQKPNFLHSLCHKGYLFVSVKSKLPFTGSWCVLVCGALLARRAGRSSDQERHPDRSNLGSAVKFHCVCFSAPPLPHIPNSLAIPVEIHLLAELSVLWTPT